MILFFRNFFVGLGRFSIGLIDDTVVVVVFILLSLCFRLMSVFFLDLRIGQGAIIGFCSTKVYFVHADEGCKVDGT